MSAELVTNDDIEAVIVNERYHLFHGTTATVCMLTLANGHKVFGNSVCRDASEFDEKKGRKRARDNAKSKIWNLEAYARRY